MRLTFDLEGRWIFVAGHCGMAQFWKTFYHSNVYKETEERMSKIILLLLGRIPV